MEDFKNDETKKAESQNIENKEENAHTEISNSELMQKAHEAINLHNNSESNIEQIYSIFAYLSEYKTPDDSILAADLQSINFYEFINFLLNNAFENQLLEYFDTMVTYLDILTSTTTAYSSYLFSSGVFIFFVVNFQNIDQNFIEYVLIIISNILHDCDINFLEEFINNNDIMHIADMFYNANSYITHNIIIQIMITIFNRCNNANIGFENSKPDFSAEFLSSLMEVHESICLDKPEDLQVKTENDVGFITVISKLFSIAGYNGSEDVLMQLVEFLKVAHSRSDNCDSESAQCLAMVVKYMTTPIKIIETMTLFEFANIFGELPSKPPNVQQSYVNLYFAFLGKLILYRSLDESITQIFEIMSHVFEGLVYVAQFSILTNFTVVIHDCHDVCLSFIGSGLFNSIMQLLELDEEKSNSLITDIFYETYQALESHGLISYLLNNENLPDWVNLFEDLEDDNPKIEICRQILTSQ